MCVGEMGKRVIQVDYITDEAPYQHWTVTAYQLGQVQAFFDEVRGHGGAKAWVFDWQTLYAVPATSE